MTTKTDYQSLVELKDKYTPATRGVVSSDEQTLIRETLELNSRTEIELNNIRDMSVMLYTQWANSLEEQYQIREAMQLMDAMSAITHVIDAEKITRGIGIS